MTLARCFAAIVLTCVAIAALSPAFSREASRPLKANGARQASERVAIDRLKAAVRCHDEYRCDSYATLRDIERRAPASAELREGLAKQYLSLGLAWRALALAPPGGETARRSAVAMSIMRQDADLVISDEVAQNDPIASRLRLLLGLSPEVSSGRFEDLEPDAARLGDVLDPLEGLEPAEIAEYQRRFPPTPPTPEELEQAAREAEAQRKYDAAMRFRPAARFLYERQPRADLESVFDVPATEQAFEPSPVSTREIDRWLRSARSEMGGTLGPATRGFATLFAAVNGEDFGAEVQPETRISSVVEHGNMTVVSITAFEMVEDNKIFLLRTPGGYKVAVGGYGGSTTGRWLTFGKSEKYLVYSTDGSGNYVTLELYDFKKGTVEHLAPEDWGHGTVALLQLDDDPELEIVLTKGVYGSARFGTCNQCPRRRDGLLLDYDTRDDRFRIVGAAQSGSFEYAPGQGGLFGSLYMSSYGHDLAVAKLLGELTQARAGGSPIRVRQAAGAAVLYARELQNGRAEVAALDLLRQVADVVAMAPNLDPKFRTAVKLELAKAMVLADKPKDGMVLAASLTEPTDRGGLTAYLSIYSVAAIQAGDLGKAYALLERTRDEGLEDSTFVNSRANLLNRVGAWDAARAEFERLVPMAVKEDNRAAAGLAMLRLAQMAERDGDDEGAVDWLARAIRIGVTANSVGTPLAYQAAADLALKRGHPQLSEVLINNALFRFDEAVWNETGASFLLQQGALFEKQGLTELALRAYRAAAGLSTTSGVTAVRAFGELGRLSERMNRRSEADAAYRNAFLRAINGRRGTPTEDFKVKFLDDVARVVDTFFSREIRGRAAPQALADELESWKFKVFSDLYPQTGPPMESSSTKALQARLDPRQAYISYYIGDQTSFVVVVTRDRIDTHPLDLLAPQARILRARLLSRMDPSNTEARADIEARAMPAGLDRDLRRAHDKLIAPLKLPSRIRSVVIAPDEDIAGVPWIAIPARSSNWFDILMRWLGRPRIHSLLERYEVTLTPSADVAMRRSEGTSAQAGAPLVVVSAGGVTADRIQAAMVLAPGARREAGLSALKSAGGEARAVVAALPGATLLADQSAGLAAAAGQPTRSSVLKALPKANIWHFVGHGVFNPGSPMDSTLFLDPSGAKDDRALTPRDLAGADLHGLQFVALSSCQTGISAGASGGESFGFLRALLSSRVHRALLMGWQVDDQATADFYRVFYAHYGEGASSAYRAAALDMKARYRHPFYWASGAYYGGI